jgi:hypothetical protein
MAVDKNIWVVIGLLVAPLAPAIYFSLMTQVTSDPASQPNFGLVPLFYPYVLAVSFFLGLPAYLLARRLSLVTWWSALIVGVAISALFANQLHDLLILCPLGAASALLFWVFAKRAQE